MGEGLGQSGDDGVDLGFGEGVVEGEGDRALGDGLGDGQGAARFAGEVAEALPDVITDDTDFGISRMGEGLGQGGDDCDGACHVFTGWVSLSSSSSG